MTKDFERIKVNNVSKKFNLDFKRNDGALARVLYFLQKNKNRKELLAVNDISLSVKAGEVLGIIGKNGSGKSTLLKIIAGLYAPDKGSIELNGRSIYLSGFGQGMIPKLTMRENVFLTGSIMGLSQKDIKGKMEQIIGLSGLNDFLDVKVYQFSSGMVARLNFAVMINVLKHHNPEILLLDEVFGAGGDIEFQNKGTEKMKELLNSGTSVIFVSHTLDQIEKYCNRVLWLDKGVVVLEGNPKEIIEKYKDGNFKK